MVGYWGKGFRAFHWKCIAFEKLVTGNSHWDVPASFRDELLTPTHLDFDKTLDVTPHWLMDSNTTGSTYTRHSLHVFWELANTDLRVNFPKKLTWFQRIWIPVNKSSKQQKKAIGSRLPLVTYAKIRPTGLQNHVAYTKPSLSHHFLKWLSSSSNHNYY